VFGNVFFHNLGRSASPYAKSIISLNGGHDHVVANNLFIENNVKFTDGHEYAKEHPVFEQRKFMMEGDVDVTKPPYSEKYPDFLKTYTAANDTDRVPTFGPKGV
jgi:hypothetical protein